MTPVIVHLIAAARPNFMKIAPLYHALRATNWAEPVLVHTGRENTERPITISQGTNKLVRAVKRLYARTQRKS